MATVIHMVRRTKSAGDNNSRDGVEAALITIDDAVQTTDAAIRAYAVTVLNAAGFSFPSDYFDSNALIAGAMAMGGQIYDTPGNYAVVGKILAEDDSDPDV